MRTYKRFKKYIYEMVIPILKFSKFLRWHIYLNKSKEINLIVGAGDTRVNGWFDTDIDTLNVIKEEDFTRYFSKKKIDKILAEHVLEHLMDDELELMVANFFKYSSRKVNIRIAVPDGFHHDSNYIDYVKPGGTGDGAHDHKNLFNYKTLGFLFEKHGFKAKLIEYWDENKYFHMGYLNDNKGFIQRSMLNDERNSDGKPHYTSLIIDFTKL